MPPADQHLALRPLVLGSDGLVGRAVSQHLEARYPHTVSATRTELDITDRWRLESEIERLEPTVLVNCAALSNVDACENDPQLAARVNAEGPGHLAQACRHCGVRVVHLSTDYVFGGREEGEYDEADAPDPVNAYGRTKLEGEMAVLETLADAVVVRVSFVFGEGRKTFLDSIVEKALASKAELPVVDTWTTRPTHAGEIARGIEAILASDVTGLWHFACPPAVSRLGFARKVLELLGEDPARAVPLPVTSLDLPARRPPRTPLSTRRFGERFAWQPRPWPELAASYLAGSARGERR